MKLLENKGKITKLPKGENSSKLRKNRAKRRNPENEGKIIISREIRVRTIKYRKIEVKTVEFLKMEQNFDILKIRANTSKLLKRVGNENIKMRNDIKQTKNPQKY